MSATGSDGWCIDQIVHNGVNMDMCGKQLWLDKPCERASNYGGGIPRC